MSTGERERCASRASDPRSGQALVEFALVAPILLLLILGVVEFGRAWNAYQVITDAAREGARTAVVDNVVVTQDSVFAVIRDALQRAALDPDSADIEVTGWRTGRGSPATVSISYPYDFVFLSRLLGWLGGDGVVTLRTTFSMRNE